MPPPPPAAPPPRTQHAPPPAQPTPPPPPPPPSAYPPTVSSHPPSPPPVSVSLRFVQERLCHQEAGLLLGGNPSLLTSASRLSLLPPSTPPPPLPLLLLDSGPLHFSYLFLWLSPPPAARTPGLLPSLHLAFQPLIPRAPQMALSPTSMSPPRLVSTTLLHPGIPLQSPHPRAQFDPYPGNFHMPKKKKKCLLNLREPVGSLSVKEHG